MSQQGDRQRSPFFILPALSRKPLIVLAFALPSQLGNSRQSPESKPWQPLIVQVGLAERNPTFPGFNGLKRKQKQISVGQSH
jgi:hypothetical protein